MLFGIIIGRVILVEPCGMVVRDMLPLGTEINLTLHNRVDNTEPNGSGERGWPCQWELGQTRVNPGN